MSIAEIRSLCKTYPGFKLDNVSFNLEAGQVTGFIGRNGAGKTTTIKSMLNLVHPDSGEITFFGKTFAGNEAEIKQNIGYSTGTINWYPRKRIKDIIEVTKRFYKDWDDKSYREYLEIFNIDENKKPIELSEGMKVKCNLMMALSHKARLLILDEPTSGLDPFSRDELVDLFLELKKKGIAVFYSTHIISDIEKSADNIIYISNGRIVEALGKQEFIDTMSVQGETLEQTFLRMERGKRNDEYSCKRD